MIIIPNPPADNFFQRGEIVLFPKQQPIFRFKRRRAQKKEERRRKGKEEVKEEGGGPN